MGLDKRAVLLRHMAKFALVGLVALGSKLALQQLFELWMNPLVAYLATHVVLFGISYLLHSRFTFSAALGWRSVYRFLKAVLLIKVLDYLIFSVAFVYFRVESTWAVLLASLVIAAVRFVFARKALYSSPKDD